MDLWRTERVALSATFRSHYGVSAWDIGVGRSVGWGEAIDLTTAAMEDTSTPLFVALAKWDYPATQVELLNLAAISGKAASKVLPYNPDSGPHVSDEETAAAHEELLAEIRFT